jgi:alcohol dehydrogenase
MSVSRFYLPTRLIMGSGSLSNLGKEAKQIGKTAMVVTGSNNIRKSGVLEKVLKDLEQNGITVITYEKIEPNPRAFSIDEGARLARERGVDFIIGIGGGSTMDASKCIALACTGDDSIVSHYLGKVSGNPKAIPVILVPTLAASGSEANCTAVFTDWNTHEKVILSNNSMFPVLSIIDPVLTLTLPSKNTAQGGVDVFCHLVEAYITATETTLINDAIRESCMRTVVETLPSLLSTLDDIELRTRISTASTIACSQFARLGGGTGAFTLHGMEHPLSALYDITHGDGLASLLVEWMQFNLPTREQRFKQLGKNVFGEDDGINATAKWLKKVSMNHKLRDLGVKEEDFDKLAENALKTGSFLIKLSPRPADKAAIAEIYRKSF